MRTKLGTAKGGMPSIGRELRKHLPRHAEHQERNEGLPRKPVIDGGFAVTLERAHSTLILILKSPRSGRLEG